MKAIYWVVLIVALISVGTFGVMFWYFNSTEQIPVTSIVVEKYMYEETDIVIVVGDDVGVGIPITSMTYVLVLEDGTTQEVAWDIFFKARAGDEFTYYIRVWK